MVTHGQQFLETTTQTVSWFQGRLRDDELELKPLFQRNPVWLHPQKSYLIDSILRGYPVPELYLQNLDDGEGGDRHVVVDGQQRIRACLEFLEDGYALTEEGAPWDGSYFSDLSADHKRQVRQYKFSIRILPELDDSEIRELFQRLNRNNLALNKQELRNATYWGRFIGTMKDLSEDPFWVDIGVFTANDFRRMLDVEFISELAIASLYGPQNKKASLDKYYENFEEEFPAEQQLRLLFARVIPVLREVVDWDRPSRWSKKSDFYTLFSSLARENNRALGDATNIATTRARLADFSDKVNAFLERDAPSSEDIRDYARAVQRAASDLANRRVREAALIAFLSDGEYVRPEPTRSAETSSALDALRIIPSAIEDDDQDDEETS